MGLRENEKRRIRDSKHGIDNAQGVLLQRKAKKRAGGCWRARFYKLECKTMEMPACLNAKGWSSRRWGEMRACGWWDSRRGENCCNDVLKKPKGREPSAYMEGLALEKNLDSSSIGTGVERDYRGAEAEMWGDGLVGIYSSFLVAQTLSEVEGARPSSESEARRRGWRFKEKVF